MKLTGAQIFFECLKAEGVEVIFGLPGGVLLDLYDHEQRDPNRYDGNAVQERNRPRSRW